MVVFRCSCWITGIILIISGCQQTESPYQVVMGETMGTYYRITYQSQLSPATIKAEMDSILIDINNDVSTYIPSAIISQVNQSEDGAIASQGNGHFWPNMDRAQYWYKRSEGHLDASVMPLINYWGFGYSPKNAVTQNDSTIVDSIMTYVGLDKWNIDLGQKIISKIDPRQQLDFSSLAKGYAVDMLAKHLRSYDIDNYLVDIGGDEVGAGVNDKGQPWVLAVSRPQIEAQIQDAIAFLQLDNMALASSGNYRNYHKVGDQMYGHTIDPFSGYPYQDSLLAVSVLAKDCIDADALATACMAMGYAKAATFIDELDDVTACFFIGLSDGSIATKYADGFIRYALD